MALNENLKKVALLFFIICSILSQNGCLPSDKKRNKRDNKPNVVLIMTDDQGWGDLSINGNKNVQTPHIDQIAKDGVRFDKFYVSPVCSPTRAELLTGRYAERGGVYSTSEGGERLDLDEFTLAEYLKGHGYATACYGKWHNGMQYPYHPNARGFDDFYGFCSGHWGNYIEPMLERNGEIVKGEGFIIDDFTNKGIDFINKNKDQPFFLYLPYNTPHTPMHIPDEWWNNVKDRRLVSRHKAPQNEDSIFTQAVLAFTENIDWNVGRVIHALKKHNLEDNTLVIYLSDNGPNSWRYNDGMRGKKGWTDEGGVRSPLFIQLKGTLKNNVKIHEIASVRDLLPTVLEMVGFSDAFKKPIDGKSLVPLLMNQSDDWPDRHIINSWRGNVSVRSQIFRLDAKNRLYDMQLDPGQNEDVSEGNTDIVNELVSTKETWISEVQSELPIEDERTFPVGHPDAPNTQLPARDADYFGNIERSNRWPNCSYFTNWTSVGDSISWDVEVIQEGDFEAIVYYTCKENNVGAELQLSFLEDKITTTINQAHYPELNHATKYRTPISVSYTKDFKAKSMGEIYLKKGKGIITLKALDMPGKEVIDFRLLMLKRKLEY